jgi:uncharacterized protein YecE (DUF72 family)
MGKIQGSLYIGTSGWSYSHWGGGIFYPPDLRQKGWLTYYSKHFQTVEINNSFYRLPREETFQAWRDSVPDGFVFAVKVSRFVTHMKKLSDPEVSMRNFLENVSGLGVKLGPLLFQLPPFWKVNTHRLSQFLAYLDTQRFVKHPAWVFEFRNPTWICDEVFDLLKRYHASLCLADWPDLNVMDPHGSEIIYLRRHGTQELYASSYTDEELKGDAKKIRTWMDQGKEIFCYFNNDAEGWAVKDAHRLIHLLGN